MHVSGLLLDPQLGLLQRSASHPRSSSPTRSAHAMNDDTGSDTPMADDQSTTLEVAAPAVPDPTTRQPSPPPPLPASSSSSSVPVAAAADVAATTSLDAASTSGDGDGVTSAEAGGQEGSAAATTEPDAVDSSEPVAVASSSSSAESPAEVAAAAAAETSSTATVAVGEPVSSEALDVIVDRLADSSSAPPTPNGGPSTATTGDDADEAGSSSASRLTPVPAVTAQGDNNVDVGQVGASPAESADRLPLAEGLTEASPSVKREVGAVAAWRSSAFHLPHPFIPLIPSSL